MDVPEQPMQGTAGVCTSLTCNPASGGQYCGTVATGAAIRLLAVRIARRPAAAGCAAATTCAWWTELPEAELQQRERDSAVLRTVVTVRGTLGCAATCANERPAGRDAQCLRTLRRPVLESGSLQRHGHTSISGTVYDPAGYNQLYNVIVSIPNAALDPIPAGDLLHLRRPGIRRADSFRIDRCQWHFQLNNVPWALIFRCHATGQVASPDHDPKSMVTNKCGDNPLPRPSR